MVSLYKHHAPSTTSLSDDADDLDNEEDINQLTFYSNHQLVPAQWKHSHIVQRPAAVYSPISTIPQEILIQIFKHLHSSKDIYSALRVSRMWCQCAVELLWHKPSFPKYNTISKMAKLLRKSDSTFTYARFIRRLNFLNHGPDFEDNAFSVFGRCDRLERLTLIGCKNLTGAMLAKILPMFSNLVAIDLTGVDNCTSDAIIGLASVASRLQGINISGCKQVTDPGIVALSQQCPLLRRVKLSGLVLITDVAISALATGCPMLLEIDLNGCKLITDVSVRLIWTNLLHMREMRLGHCDKLTDLAFPSPVRVDNEVNPFANARPDDLPPLIINRSFDNLRMLDLTACALITDSAVEGLVSHAPKIRNLVLSKCVLLTDKAVEKICRLGRHLHYLHLGHASKISDASVRLLARSCTRIRYIDFANCVLLTDMSVFELSALPKLRRVGLVRVNQLTDEAIYALGERHATLERIHLSYCDQISVMAIHFLLLKLHKLTHLSLTGVPSFRQAELQQFCREAPKDFNSTQRQAFCVFSGKGVSQLRAYLTELFDRITENNNTDDTEYEEEDEFDGEGYQEDETPEPEATFTTSQMQEQGYPRREMLFNPQAAPQPQSMPLPHQPHEFNFQRDRSHRPATLPAPPAQYQPLNIPVTPTAHHLQGATNSLNAQIQASSSNAVASSSRPPRTVRHGHSHGHGQGHGHSRTAADVLPIVESSQSSNTDLPSIVTPSHPGHPGAFHDNGAGFFRSYQDRAATGPSPRGHGALTPDLNYAEIGHGRGAQNAESTTTLATLRPIPPFAGPRERAPRRPSVSHVSPAPEPPHSESSRANSADNSENDMRRPVFSQPVPQSGPTNWPYQEPNVASAQELTASLQMALGTGAHADPRARREQFGSSDVLPQGSDSRGHGVRRNLRSTLHAAENYATNFLFGRGTPGDSNSNHGGSSSGSSSRPR
ncbi:hypothetical protein D9619_000640 [Psilocybe cf. subviscida]|uniref:F-box domain-containing protein n=1 Tax=Psilocybe cf. subviscida TaxID=2480587 RepID=A0A8H5F3T3_9AGAR|nr:hypothetical protein D9619_000640 [Psilocybe cf. subviscida]